MNWRPVGAPGDRYPAWVRELSGKSGAYAIREGGIFGAKVVYVGESHTGRLRKTLTRHFQAWGRSSTSWWKLIGAGQYPDPGFSYDRSACEVAIVVTPAGSAVAQQSAWIGSLNPRDNQIGKR